MTAPNSMLTTLIRITRLLLTYLLGQGLTQVVRLLTGFILIRTLAKADYATFTIAMAIYGTSGILVELGIGQALTALIGKVHGDFAATGRYISACRFYRNRMLLVGVVALFTALYFLAPVYQWGTYLWLLVWASITGSLILRTIGSMYQPILLLNQDLKRVYAIELASGLARLSFIVIAYYCGFLSAQWAIVIGVLQSLIEAWGYLALTKDKFISPVRSIDISLEKKIQ